MDKEIELLNCPFCGSDDVSLEWMYEPDDEFGTDLALAPQGSDFYIQCKGCSMASDNYMSPEVVVRLWNTRAVRTDGWNVISEVGLPENDAELRYWISVKGGGMFYVAPNAVYDDGHWQVPFGEPVTVEVLAYQLMEEPKPYTPTPAESESEGDVLK